MINLDIPICKRSNPRDFTVDNSSCRPPHNGNSNRWHSIPYLCLPANCITCNAFTDFTLYKIVRFIWGSGTRWSCGSASEESCYTLCTSGAEAGRGSPSTLFRSSSCGWTADLWAASPARTASPQPLMPASFCLTSISSGALYSSYDLAGVRLTRICFTFDGSLCLANWSSSLYRGEVTKIVSLREFLHRRSEAFGVCACHSKLYRHVVRFRQLLSKVHDILGYVNGFQ